MTAVKLKNQCSLSGRFKLKVFNAKGEVTKETGWFDNLITNAGLDYIGSTYQPATLVNSFTVGTSNVTPIVLDTALNGPLSPTAGIGASGSSTLYVAGTPPYWSQTFTGTFAIGDATGILAEIGVFPYFGGLLFSHALILDSLGNPTTITVLATESLQVTYELRLNWDVTLQTGTMVINGITYNLTWLPMAINTPSNDLEAVRNIPMLMKVYNGTIGTVLSYPSGASASTYNGVWSSYTAGTYYADSTWTLGINDGNVSGGITAMSFTGRLFQYQLGISPAIPKDNIHSMSFTCRFGWGRV